MTPRASKLFSKIIHRFAGAWAIVVLVAAWQIFVSMSIISSTDVSSPKAVGIAAWRLVTAGPLVGYLFHTLVLTLVTWCLSVVAGGVLGILIGLWPLGRRLLLPTVEFMRNVPAVTFVPLAILIFGFSSLAEFAVATYAGVWPVVLGATNGVDRIPRRYWDVGRALGLRGRTMVRKVVIPGALGGVYTGARIALTVCLVIVVVTEMLGNPTGLGYGLVHEGDAINTAGVFSYLVVIGLLAVSLNGLFRRAWMTFRPGDAG
jgi:sulfonate transport system permease protein